MALLVSSQTASSNFARYTCTLWYRPYDPVTGFSVSFLPAKRGIAHRYAPVEMRRKPGRTADGFGNTRTQASFPFRLAFKPRRVLPSQTLVQSPSFARELLSPRREWRLQTRQLEFLADRLESFRRASERWKWPWRGGAISLGDRVPNGERDIQPRSATQRRTSDWRPLEQIGITRAGPNRPRRRRRLLQ